MQRRARQRGARVDADARRQRRRAGVGRGAPRHREEAQRRVGAIGDHRMERRRRAALQHVLQRGLEQVLDAPRANLVHRLQPELEQRAAVGGQDAPVVAHRQLALVQGVDELRPAVKVQRVRVAEAQVDQAVLDHARRHAQQHQQVLLHQARSAGHVEHGDDVARRVVHRHRRAGELRELGEEVILAPHGHRPAGGQAGAHAVGAGGRSRSTCRRRAGPAGRPRRRTRATTPCARSRRRYRSAPPPTRRRPAAGTAWSSRSARRRSRRRGARAALRARRAR